MLGETYELVMDDFKYISEQVSHHPPISAFNIDGDNFQVNGHIQSDSKITMGGGKGRMNITPAPGSIQNYILDKYNDYITVTKPDVKIHNIIMGTLYADMEGTINSVSHTTGDKAEIKMVPKGWKNPSKIEGIVKDSKGNKRFEITGSWLDQIILKDLKSNS